MKPKKSLKDIVIEATDRVAPATVRQILDAVPARLRRYPETHNLILEVTVVDHWNDYGDPFRVVNPERREG